MTLPLEMFLRAMSPRYWRRDGTPYPHGDRGLMEWSRDFERFGIRVVDESWTPWGDCVSTVWLGLDHGWGSGQLLIFETMTFDRHGNSIFTDRYSTELEAFEGHHRAFLLALIPPFLSRVRERFLNEPL